MAQGTRVSANLFHDNRAEDLFVEVDHGPFLVDNNIFLSRTTLLDVSEGGAYAHNLIAGRIVPHPELKRETPYHKAHSTEVAGLRNIVGGDNRFYNNIVVGANGLADYDASRLPSWGAFGVLTSFIATEGDTTEASPPVEVPVDNVKRYDFRRPDRFSKEQMRALRMIHETWARRVYRQRKARRSTASWAISMAWRRRSRSSGSR